MNSIADILSNHGVAYVTAPHQRVRRGWVGVDCPQCSPGHGKYRLGFQLTTGRAHCWVCGGLYAPKMLAMLLRVSIPEAKALLGDFSRHAPDEDKAPGILREPPGVGELLPVHRWYLEGRGFNPDELARVWGIKGIGPRGGQLKGRVYIPIFARDGRQVSWTTRAVSAEAKARYYSANSEEEAVPHKSILYGANLARHTIVIVEGPIDAWAIGPGAVATLGVGFTAAQAALMADYPVRVVCFDAEDDAQERSAALCEQLCLLPGKTVSITLETGKDPAECDPSEIADIRHKYFPENPENSCLLT